MENFVKHNISIITNNLYYHGKNRILAHEIKQGDMGAITLAGWEMREWISDWTNVALVPIPSHKGYATYTLRMAESIGAGCVYDILRCSSRPMLYDLKRKGRKVAPCDLGFYTIGEIPADKQVIFIDNVVGTGVTAQAAYQAVGRGAVMPFAIALVR